MKTFKDSENREWTIAVNVSSVKRVRDLINVDLLKAVEGELIGKLHDDPETLVNVIYALCKPQADERQITDEKFGEALVGDAIDAATLALLEDLVSFFPKARRGLMDKAIQKIKAFETIAIANASKRLDSPELERQLQQIASGATSTNGRESRE